MRVVLVNHCHPKTPHVCATRMREFSQVLTKLGHEVILLTETLADQPTDIPPDRVARVIQDHDFSAPLNLASEPKGHPLIKKLRAQTLPWGIRQAVVVWYYWQQHGVFTDWRAGSQPYIPPIVEYFEPDIVWATFGNTDCWNIARDLAQAANCPWIADAKDPWETFIPRALQSYLANYFSDSAAMTAFSEFHAADIQKYFGTQAAVIYSGFPASQLAPSPTPISDNITISLTGAIYDRQALDQLIQGVRSWLAGLPDEKRSNACFVYAGQDSEEVAAATSELSKICKIEIKGYIPFEELRQIHRSAIANLYIKSNRTFHHKTVEMLSAGRPLICYPEEAKEAIEISQSTVVPLFSCESPEKISAALDQSLKTGHFDIEDDSGLKKLTWESQSEKLAEILSDTLRKSKGEADA
tara:strand:+ start:665 stop:1900 length:1236 start_codon:yes stop_codon:yes gene_type:complete